MILKSRAQENPRVDQRTKKAGFVNRGGKGSHGNFEHPSGARITLSGNEGDDAHRYQEKGVRQQIEAASEESEESKLSS